MRQMLNFRYTARGRPHNSHRRTRRVENFGSRFAFNRCAFVAMASPPLAYSRRNGNPNASSSPRDSSSDRLFLITNVMFIP